MNLQARENAMSASEMVCLSLEGLIEPTASFAAREIDVN